MEPYNVLMMFAGRWGASLAGWSLASMLIWYVFPLVPFLRSPTLRVSAIVATLGVCLGVNGFIALRDRRRGRKLEGGIADGEKRDPREITAEAAAEVGQLRDRIMQALKRLRGNKRAGRLFEQPWFVLIGPPGAGKTTALLNSGLHLALGQEDEPPSLRGVGGTRLCDWWFTDEAVLIDTAGRYTTQDSDTAIDKAGWLGFLDLLRKNRPRQPINGVIVVLSLTELATAEPAERASHARSVRLRINEITERLRLRVPVYVVLSKADQVRGFDAFFDHLDGAGRSQVWGMTFPLNVGVEAFGPEFRLLLGRLEEHLVERLQAERAGERRALIGGFPLQIASLEEPVAEFLRLAFSGSRLDPAPFLRGVYMTSATQQGTPIDRLTGMLARSFGIDQAAVPALRPVSGRSYFVARLIREVILGEALLVSRKPGRWERRRLLRAIGFATIGVVSVSCAVLLWRADVEGQIAVERAHEAFAAYKQRLSGLQLDPVQTDDLPRVAPLLDAAAALPRDAEGWASRLFFGLSQGDKLAQSERLAYRNALEHILLPRLIWRLEQQMRAHFNDPDQLYEATRVYLKLGDSGPLTPSFVQAWMQADWERRFPGAINAPLREHLQRHLKALLAEPLPRLALDGALVQSARVTFSRVTLAERIYSRLRFDSAAQALPDWSPAMALGPDGVRLFTRRSGRSLSEGIPGFFTGKGYRDILLGSLPETTREAAQESWVLGHAEEVPSEGPQIIALENAVGSFYAKDLEKRWDDLLTDITIVPFRERQKSIRDLYVLSSPQSPMRDLLTAVVRQLDLSPPAYTPKKPSATSDAPSDVLSAPPSSETLPAPSAAAADVDAHFRRLFDLVGTGQASPLDNILRMINNLQQVLAAAAPGGAPLPSTLQGSGDPAELLLAEAERQPMPVSDWLRKIAKSGSAILGEASHAQASQAYASEDGPQASCHSVVDNHFPFDPRSSTDAPIDDFARLFGQGGEFDTFFQKQLSPFVDTRGAVWQAHALGGVAAPVDAATVAAFQRVAAIRQAFFPTGAAPSLSFSLSPAAGSDPTATFTIGSTSVSKDPDQAASFTWPSGSGLSAAALTFDQATTAASPLSALFGGASAEPEKASATSSSLQFSGAWSLFRLLAHGRLAQSKDPTLFTFSINLGERRAVYRLQAGSEHNPFSRDLLRGFRCPVMQ